MFLRDKCVLLTAHGCPPPLLNPGSLTTEKNVLLMESKWEPLVLKWGGEFVLINVKSPKMKYPIFILWISPSVQDWLLPRNTSLHFSIKPQTYWMPWDLSRVVLQTLIHLNLYRRICSSIIMKHLHPRLLPQSIYRKGQQNVTRGNIFRHFELWPIY